MKLLDLSKDDVKKRAKDLRDLDLEANLPHIRDIHVPYRHEEPESSSAGFIAGVAVGLLLGVVLSYLFGRSGGNEMVDQFAHRAEELKDTATEKLQHVRDQAEGGLEQTDTTGNAQG